MPALTEVERELGAGVMMGRRQRKCLGQPRRDRDICVGFERALLAFSHGMLGALRGRPHSKEEIIMQSSTRALSLRSQRRLALACCVGTSFMLAAACSDDDDDVGGTAGRGGQAGAAAVGGVGGEPGPSSGNGGSTSGNAGSLTLGGGGAGEPEPNGGASGAGAAGDSASSGAGGASQDREAFRPEERAFDQTAFEKLSLPDGFAINVYRSGLGQARMLAVHGPHVYVTQPMQGTVVRLVDANEDGVAEAQAVVASDLPMVHGIAFAGDDVYLANVHSVFHASVNAEGAFSAPVEIIDDLPDGGQHALRTLAIGPDNLLYISVGSDCDACNEPNPEHATLLRSTRAGQAAGERTIVARGLRNTVGFAWHPVTQAWWGMDQGSDWRGNDLPPEELNAITAGKNYGWPYCYANRVADPVIQDPPGQTKAAYCATTERRSCSTRRTSHPSVWPSTPALLFPSATKMAPSWRSTGRGTANRPRATASHSCLLSTGSPRPSKTSSAAS